MRRTSIGAVVRATIRDSVGNELATVPESQRVGEEKGCVEKSVAEANFETLLNSHLDTQEKSEK